MSTMKRPQLVVRFSGVPVVAACVVLACCAAKQVVAPADSPTQGPSIVTMGSQRMLVVEARGDPDVVGQETFSTLFRIYYAHPGIPLPGNVPAPRVRWITRADASTEWVGHYAMPVPDIPDGVRFFVIPPASFARWEYGEVAQITCTGGPDGEAQAIKGLKDFIIARGYSIDGPLEEEYASGPVVYKQRHPQDLVKLIRYRIKR